MPFTPPDPANLPANSRQLMCICFVLGLVLGGIMIALVVATGNTFGQQCARQHTKNTPAWTECVDQMQYGVPTKSRT